MTGSKLSLKYLQYYRYAAGLELKGLVERK